MTDQEIGVANGWEDLDEDDRHSTVAFFKGGARCVVDIDGAEHGDEVLIWHGTSELVEDSTGTYHEVTVIEGYDEIPDGTDYVIEVLKNNSDKPVNARFASDIEEAREKAREEVEKISNNEY